MWAASFSIVSKSADVKVGFYAAFLSFKEQLMNQPTNTSVTYEQLAAMLKAHQWADPAAGHHQYWKAAKAESKLWRLAQSLGGRGVEIYREAHFAHLDAIRQAEYLKGTETHKRIVDPSIAYLKKQLEQTRAKYMTPLDHFKEKLDKHDWYYEFSDDITVYRAGKANEAALEKEAKESGPEFVQALSEACNARVKNITQGSK